MQPASRAALLGRSERIQLGKHLPDVRALDRLEKVLSIITKDDVLLALRGEADGGPSPRDLRDLKKEIGKKAGELLSLLDRARPHREALFCRVYETQVDGVTLSLLDPEREQREWVELLSQLRRLKADGAGVEQSLPTRVPPRTLKVWASMLALFLESEGLTRSRSSRSRMAQCFDIVATALGSTRSSISLLQLAHAELQGVPPLPLVDIPLDVHIALHRLDDDGG